MGITSFEALDQCLELASLVFVLIDLMPFDLVVYDDGGRPCV